jgi:4-hydroxybenzoate polyprenyltransferase
MHAYSAIPDIDSDRQANLSTVATVLGGRTTIVVCLAFYSVAAFLAMCYFGLLAIGLGLVYVILMLHSLRLENSAEITKMYRLFPAVNTVVGFILFVALFLQNRF